MGARWGLVLGWVHPCGVELVDLGEPEPRRQLRLLPLQLSRTPRLCKALPCTPGSRRASLPEPRLTFPTRQTEFSSSRLHPLPRLPPHRKKSPPFQAAICLFCWTRNLLKCLSMDEATQSRRTEPGRLHGEWKIVFWDFLEFEGPMMDVHARDGNGFVSIKTQSKRITLPNRLRNVRRTGSAPPRARAAALDGGVLWGAGAEACIGLMYCKKRYKS